MTEEKKMGKSRGVSWRVVAINLISEVVVGLVVLFVELFGIPTQRGFFCDDDSIKYPYKPNTISERGIILIAILTPFILILLTEFWTFGRSSYGKARVWGRSIPLWLQTTASLFLPYLLGLGLMVIGNQVGKFTIGRLRPHFLAVCQPDVVCDGTNTGYITNFTCAGDPGHVMEARLSFPSGHAGLSFFLCTFMTMYLQTSPKWANFGFLRSLVQFLIIVASWWIALTRVMDNWHHWSDVTVGIILGITAAYITATYLTELNTKQKYSGEELLPLKRTDSPIEDSNN